MEKADYIFLSCIEEIFDLNSNIVELGSRIIDTQNDLAIRNIFKNKATKDNYIGVDFIEGNGVDKVANIEQLDFPDNYANTIIAMNLLEHVEKVWLAMEQIKRIASDSALIICATPFNYDIHGYPHDYYRFTPFFYKNQFKNYKYGINITLGYALRPKLVYFVASNSPALKEKEGDFRALFEKRYREIMPQQKSIIYGIRSKISGSFFKQPLKHHADINFEFVENTN